MCGKADRPLCAGAGWVWLRRVARTKDGEAWQRRTDFNSHADVDLSLTGHRRGGCASSGAGPGCLLYLAALKTIPRDLYEAASIDGASVWHRVFYITLPRLRYLIGIQFIAAVIGAFKGGTDYILALTGGGPNNATMILALEIFIQTFGNLRFGLGAAMAWILGAVLIGFTAYQLKMLARAEFQAARR